MSWPASPAVQTREKDFTSFIAEAASAPGAVVGAFKWGPVEDPQLLSSRGELVDTFGQPSSDLYMDFFMAHNYLSYSSSLNVVRVVVDSEDDGGTKALNASSNDEPILIKNLDDFEDRTDTEATFYAKYPGKHGNDLKIWIATENTWDDLDEEIQNIFDGEPEGDEIHIAIEDTEGWFDSEGTILEQFEYLLPEEGSKKDDGSSAYWVKVLNEQSNFIWCTGSYKDLVSDDSVDDPSLSDVDTTSVSLEGGVDGNNEDGEIEALGLKQPGYEILLDKEQYDVSLVPSGDASDELQDWILQNFCEERKDCVAFFSPPRSAAVKSTDTKADVVDWAEDRPSSSYGVMDSGWKRQYDQWNDTNRWLPLNADIAGLCAQSEDMTEAWYSPAGYNRGQIKNVIKLSWNPKRTERDALFKARVNPVMSESGEGTMLFGDQTMLSRPSAFGEIGVRRLFIVLRKSVADSAKYKLFEFNDEITRAIFRQQVRAFLRDIQSRRGITGFRVKADSDNNTAQVINQNRFVGQIAVRPNRSIRFMRLDFIATPEGVDFEEVLEQAE